MHIGGSEVICTPSGLPDIACSRSRPGMLRRSPERGLPDYSVIKRAKFSSNQNLIYYYPYIQVSGAGLRHGLSKQEEKIIMKIKTREESIRRLKASRELGLRSYKQLTYMSREQLQAMNTEVQKSYAKGLLQWAVMDNVDQAVIELGFEPRELRVDYEFPWDREFTEQVFITTNDDGSKEQWFSNQLTWKCPSCSQFCSPEHGCLSCDEWPTGPIGKTTEAHRGWPVEQS